MRELNDENSLSLVVKNLTHSSLNNVSLTERCDPIILLLPMITAIYNLTGFPTQLAIMVVMKPFASRILFFLLSLESGYFFFETS